MILSGVIVCGFLLASSTSFPNGEEVAVNVGLRFDCGNEKLIPIIYKCDGDDDCGNGADEQECTLESIFHRRIQNLELFFRILRFDCGNGGRVQQQMVCNGVDDCGNGADERDCEHNGFDCGNGKKVPNRYVCDNDDDCGNGADERNCTNSPRRISSPCAFSRLFNFDCGNGKTVPRIYLCDRDNDCGNGADEQNCTHSLATNSPSLPTTPGLFNFDCGNGKLVPRRYLCDRDDDCGNGADEQNCTDSLTTNSPSLHISLDRFDCGNGHTVPRSYLCNRRHDCWNGADERNCFSRSLMNDRFDCGNGHTVPRSYLCNGRHDCRDGADERNCFSRYLMNVCGRRLYLGLSVKRNFSYTKPVQERLENHQSCNWTFISFSGLPFELEFLEFQVGENRTEDNSAVEVELATLNCKDETTGECVQYNSQLLECPDDYIEVFDGPNDSSLRLGRFCGNKVPPTVTSSDKTLFVRFHYGQTRQPARFFFQLGISVPTF